MGKLLTVMLSAFLIVSTGCLDASYPFDQVTDEFTFTYDLPQEGTVDLIVLNCYMNNIRTLLSDSVQASGSHTSSWNLLDENAIRVPDGLYYIRIIFNTDVIETKMIEVYE